MARSCRDWSAAAATVHELGERHVSLAARGRGLWMRITAGCSILGLVGSLTNTTAPLCDNSTVFVPYGIPSEVAQHMLHRRLGKRL